VSFGVRLPVAGALASRDAIRSAALHAAELQFHSVWAHDFLIWTRELDRIHVSCGSVEAVEQFDPPPTFHESLTTMAFVAGLTPDSPLRFGTSVLCLPYRNPVIAARQIANIDQLSGGRYILGVGVGAPKDIKNRDFEVLGVPRERRYARTREYLLAMKAIWGEDVSSFEGEFVSIPELEFSPKPAQKPHPPIWFGGSGPTTLKLIAELGEGWIPGLMRPEDFAEKLDIIHQHMTELGREDRKLTVGAEMTAVSIAATTDLAVESARRTVDSVIEGYGGGAHGTVDERRVTETTLMGSPDAIIERVKDFQTVGVEHFELKFVYHSVEHLLDQMKLFAAEVMPNV
jgi:probable F420-dependent oxidoreductase